MLQFILLVISLAVYGVYALMSSFFQEEPAAGRAAAAMEQRVVAESQLIPSNLNDLTNAAASVASRAAGLKLEPLPSEGCSQSALSADKLDALLATLPQAQQVALARILRASASVWTLQLYHGSQGAGLCLPVQDKLLLVPGLAAVDDAGDSGEIQNTIANALNSIGDRLPALFERIKGR